MSSAAAFRGHVPPPAEIAEALLGASARLGPMAGRLLWYAQVPSTNTVALAHAEHGADEGLVVAADMQTAGRGRLGRSWASPAGAGIYASVLFRPGLRVAPLMTIAAGVAMADGIAAASGLQADLKWPNDIYARGRKLGGILAEAAATHVVIGFGINVHHASMPPEVAERSTSIARELQASGPTPFDFAQRVPSVSQGAKRPRQFNRGAVLAECLAALWQRYQDLEAHRERDVVDAWRARAVSTMNRSVEWIQGGTTETGRAVGVDDSGALLMETSRGTIRVVSGEVRWV